MNRRRRDAQVTAEGEARMDVLKKFAATQMLAVHAARRSKRQRLERAMTTRTLQNVENLMRFQKAGMANRKEAFVECIANMGTQAIDVLSQAIELEDVTPFIAPVTSTPASGIRILSNGSPVPSDNINQQAAVDLTIFSNRVDATTGLSGPRLQHSPSQRQNRQKTHQQQQQSVITPTPQRTITPNSNGAVQPEGFITPASGVSSLSVTLEAIPDGQFFDLFRLKRDTFLYLYEELCPYLEGDSYSAQLNIAIALWVLGGSEPLHTPLLLIPEEQRTECTLDFCRCVTRCLMPKVISINDRMDTTMWNFQCKFGLRNCAGALNFTHIPVHLGDNLKDDSCEYVNQAGFRSIIMQAVVSSDYRFCDLSIGYPGRTPVDRVLYNSALWRKAESGVLFPTSPGGPNQGPHPYLIAGTCYPLSERIVTPFQAPKFSDIEKRFNNSIYNALSVTQRAFKLLRSRFPFLLDLSGVAVEDAPSVAAACCVLHNVCEARGEITRSSWEAKATSRQHHHLTMAQGQAALEHEPDLEAVLFREMVKNSMIHNYDRKF
ncbi:uncharacterized protein LOC111249506 isoform X2 [Varroa destructor]|uniref:DDE Tnp4 domain-containing protein n=1 Tax=Varroa destructor TaxID=109461 RepID=A0A7M7K1N9_VARDE|nr:uncharacterized protein LOC111249506 isoform X2 [Varroa destructor]